MKKRFIIDSILNIVSAAVPLVLLQIIIFPIIALHSGESNYGMMITLISFFTLFSNSFGNVLNNVRLIQNEEYEKNKYIGDFNILFLFSLVLNSTIMIVGVIYYQKKVSIIDITLIVLLSVLVLAREYYIVTFRLTLNYKSILYNNLLMGLGYLLGLGVFIITSYWQAIYIIGAFFSLIFIFKNSNLHKEKIIKTPMFKKTSYKSLILLISAVMKSALNYADKLILLPLLGPVAVSIYYTSTIFGKLITPVITPISGVFLSYLAKIESISIRNFIKIFFYAVGFGIVGYFICILISGPILKILYPKWAEESIKLIYITTGAAIIRMIISILNPIILRYNNINWQLILSGTNLIIYIICVYVFYFLYGLIGFSFGTLISGVFNLIMIIIVYVIKNEKRVAS